MCWWGQDWSWHDRGTWCWVRVGGMTKGLFIFVGKSAFQVGMEGWISFQMNCILKLYICSRLSSKFRLRILPPNCRGLSCWTCNSSTSSWGSPMIGSTNGNWYLTVELLWRWLIFLKKRGQIPSNCQKGRVYHLSFRGWDGRWFPSKLVGGVDRTCPSYLAISGSLFGYQQSNLEMEDMLQGLGKYWLWKMAILSISLQIHRLHRCKDMVNGVMFFLSTFGGNDSPALGFSLSFTGQIQTADIPWTAGGTGLGQDILIGKACGKLAFCSSFCGNESESPSFSNAKSTVFVFRLCHSSSSLSFQVYDVLYMYAILYTSSSTRKHLQDRGGQSGIPLGWKDGKAKGNWQLPAFVNKVWHKSP